MNQETIATLLRTLLKVGGGALVSKGLIDDTGWAEISGALLTIFGVVWGIVAARRAAAKKPAPGISVPLMALAAAIGLSGAAGLTGCMTPAQGIVTMTSVVDSAMKDWAAASVAGETTPDLDAKVMRAHDRYRVVCDSALTVLQAAKDNGQKPDTASALRTVRAAVDPLFDLLTPLFTPAQADALNRRLNQATAI